MCPRGIRFKARDRQGAGARAGATTVVPGMGLSCVLGVAHCPPPLALVSYRLPCSSVDTHWREVSTTHTHTHAHTHTHTHTGAVRQVGPGLPILQPHQTSHQHPAGSGTVATVAYRARAVQIRQQGRLT